MKTIVSSIGGLGFVVGLHAGSTIHIADKFAYGANIGWMDWRGEGGSGAVIGEYHLSIPSFIATSMGTSDTIAWNSRPTREYRIQKTSRPSEPISWVDIGLGLISPEAGSMTTRAFTDSARPQQFFRIQAIKPLSFP